MVGFNLETLTFSVSCLGNSTHRKGHKIEKKREALPTYSARFAPEEIVLQCAVLFLGAKGNFHIGLMCFMKPLLTFEEIKISSRILFTNLIFLSCKNLKGVLINIP